MSAIVEQFLPFSTHLFDNHANTSGEHGNAPAAMKNVPAYLTEFLSEANSIMYPTAAIRSPAAMKGPLILNLSIVQANARTVRNPKKFGATVYSCAMTVLVVKVLLIVGRKRLKL